MPYPPYPYFQPYPGPYAPPPPVIDDEGQAQPPGYHRETRPRNGPVIAGWIVFGIFYGTTATVGLNGNKDEWLVVPVVGPIAWASSRECKYSCEDTLSTYSFLGQLTGVGLLALGYGAPRKVFVRDAGTLRVLPMLSPRASGITAVAEF